MDWTRYNAITVFFLCMLRQSVRENLASADQEQVMGIVVLVMILFISPTIIVLVRNATVTVQVWNH